MIDLILKLIFVLKLWINDRSPLKACGDDSGDSRGTTVRPETQDDGEIGNTGRQFIILILSQCVTSIIQ